MKKFILVSWVFIFLSYILGAQCRFALPSGEFITELSLSIAKTQVGISDAKNPDRIRDYLKSAKVGYYNPFCASGQYWSWVQAKNIITSINAMFGTNYSTVIPYPRSALANSPYFYAAKHGTKTAYIPEIGDFLIWFVAKTFSGHIERVTEIGKAGWVQCVGFNTGNREVKITKRNIFSPIGRRLVRGLVGFKKDKP